MSLAGRPADDVTSKRALRRDCPDDVASDALSFFLPMALKDQTALSARLRDGQVSSIATTDGFRQRPGGMRLDASTGPEPPWIRWSGRSCWD